MSETFDGVALDRFAVDSFGQPAIRLAIGMELYFPRPMAQYRAQVLEVWKRFLAWRGDAVMTWARLGGGNKSRKMAKAAYATIESWLSGSRPYGRLCFIQVHDGEFEAIGSEAFRVYGDDQALDLDSGDTTIGYVQIRVPLASADDPAALAAQLIALAEPLEFVCGTAGLMLLTTPFGADNLWKEVRGIVTRYEGVEPDGVEKGKWRAILGLTGINWLTFVGARQLETLGGAEAVEAAAAATQHVSVQRVGQGVVLQAGPRPRVGDRNKPSDALDPYREVHSIVGGALLLDHDYAFDHDDFDGIATVEWLQRFGRTP